MVYIESKSGTKYLVHKDNLRKQKAELLGDVVEKMYILKNHLNKIILDIGIQQEFIPSREVPTEWWS